MKGRISLVVLTLLATGSGVIIRLQKPVAQERMLIRTMSGQILGDFFAGLGPDPIRAKIVRVRLGPGKGCDERSGTLAEIGNVLGLYSVVHAQSSCEIESLCTNCYTQVNSTSCGGSCPTGQYNYAVPSGWDWSGNQRIGGFGCQNTAGCTCLLRTCTTC